VNTQSRNRKLLIYAGVAGAVLALVVIIKRKASGTTAPAEEAATPTYASAPGSIPAVGESGSLQAFEQQLAAQLPAAIESGVKAGLTNNQAVPAASPTLAEIIGSLGTFIGAVNSNRTGEQTGAGAQGSPSQGTTPTQPAPAPAAPAPSSPPPSSPAPTVPPKAPPPSGSGCPPDFPNRGPHGCWRWSRTKTPDGCSCHGYQNGMLECEHKVNGRCTF
jgi:hypothetical protein